MKKRFLLLAAMVVPTFVVASDNLSLSTIQSSAYYQHLQDEKIRWSMQGIYFDANAGYGFLDVKNSGLSESDLRGFSWNGDLGYQFNQYIGLEVGYTQIENTKIMVNHVAQNRQFSGIDLLFKFIIPFTRQFNMFFKAGAMGAESTALSSNTTTALKTRIVPDMGMGLGYYLTPSFALNFQGIVTFASESSTIPLTYAGYLGLSYKIKT